MSNRTIKLLKVVVFVLACIPVAGMVWQFQTNNLGADPVNTLTHETGNWTVYMLLVSLAITPLRRLSPKLAWLIRFRRMLGLWAFFWATLHLLTYVLLFSGFDITGAIAAIREGHWHVVKDDWVAVWPTMVEDVRKRRFIQVGLLAYAILFALAATSPAWVMRKMGGKPWQTLHRTVYAAAVLGIIHYWWLVKPGNRAPLKDTVVLALLLAARPATRWMQDRAAANRKLRPAT